MIRRDIVVIVANPRGLGLRTALLTFEIRDIRRN